MQRKLRALYLCVLLLPSVESFAVHTRRHSQPHKPVPQQEPWFIGPLITPAPNAVSIGHFNVEPYIFFTTNYGAFGPDWKSTSLKHNVYKTNLAVPVQVGIAKMMDFTFTPQAFYNFTRHAHAWEFGDLPFGFDIQLLAEEPHKWWPSIKLYVGGNFPFGKYEHLNPKKLGTDGVGAGSWLPQVSFNFGWLIHFSGIHYLNTRTTIAYTMPTPTHVVGLNVYGGGHGTHGTVRPGNVLTAEIGLEFSLTQNWVLASDLVYTHTDSTLFHGHTAGNKVGLPSNEQFSVAPAIEYDWNEHLGLIAGVQWFFAGRNAAQSAIGIFAFNVYY